MNNNNNTFPTQGFTWTLNDSDIKIDNEFPFGQQQQQQQQQQFPLTEADLYQLLLGDETQQQLQLQPPENCLYSVSGDSSSTSEDITTIPKKVKKNNNNNNKPPASSTGKLDFRPIHDSIPESQLKAMTSKERRQLRNKISARNFRNRRKEYMGNLEEELNQQKAENSQLKLEIKWLKSNMEKVQKENDRLRMELMLKDNNDTSYALDSTSLINSTMNFANTTNSNVVAVTTSSDESSGVPSPPNLFVNFPDNWDFVLPNNNTFLSHALVPNWNFNHILRKETSSTVAQSPNLLQQYPLLAPALMSIVLQHTMTMSTDELLATAKLSPPTIATCIPFDKKLSTPMSQKEARAVWDMLEPLRHMNERNNKFKKSKSANTMVLIRRNEAGEEEFCPMTWLRQSALRYLCEIVAAVTSDSPAQPLRVSQKANIQEIPKEDPASKKKFILCRKYQEAVKYITASS